jgi:hypothetical protein
MWNNLITEDFDLAEKLVRERADTERRECALDGQLCQWQDKLKEFARTCIYNQFMKFQVRSGNHDGHAVPAGW